MNIFKKLKIKLIILLFGNRKKCKNIDLKNVKSILINPKEPLGDTLIAFYHIKQLKKIYPNAKIGIVATKKSKKFVELFNLDENMEKIVDEIIESEKIIKQFRKWELLLDFQNRINTKFLIWIKKLSPKIIMSFGKDDKRHYYNRYNIKIFNIIDDSPKDTHIIDCLIYSEFSKYFNVKRENLKLVLKETEEEKNEIEKIWDLKNNFDKKIKILIAPQGSSRFIKEEEMSVLLNGISKEKCKNVKIVMSRVSDSEKYFEKLISLTSKSLKISLSKELPIEKYVKLVKSADLVIGVDSGSVHIACALNKPILSFYAKNRYNLYRWSPVPNKGVDNLQIISNIDGSQDDTFNFPMKKAIEWLNYEIDKLQKLN